MHSLLILFLTIISLDISDLKLLDVQYSLIDSLCLVIPTYNRCLSIVAEAIEGFFAESRFAEYELNWARVENLAKAALSAPDKMMILLAERLGKSGQQLIGFAMCSIGGYIAVVGLKLCQIQFLHVLPEFRKGFVGGKAMIGLLRGVEQWAKAQEAKDISIDLQMSDITPGLEKLLVKMNYREQTRGFVR